MIHYHGTPITPRESLLRLAGRHFCVSFAAQQDIEAVHQIGQSVMLDNGAFTFWRTGRASSWPAYYAWADRWLNYPTTWAVIPDQIDGDERGNDALMAEWPFGQRGAPVWHLHESVDRLLRLADTWPRLCLGSSGAYATVGAPAWHGRMTVAYNALALRHRRLPWVHGMRMMQAARWHYPLASVDSTDAARNHNRPQNDLVKMVERWDRLQCPATWSVRPAQIEFPA